MEDQWLRPVRRDIAVPGQQQVARRAGGALGRRDVAQQRAGASQFAGEEGDGIALHGGEAGGIVPGPGRQQVADPAEPPVAGPVAAEEDRMVGRRHPVVGIGQHAARRVLDMRHGVEGHEAQSSHGCRPSRARAAVPSPARRTGVRPVSSMRDAARPHRRPSGSAAGW